MRGFCYSKFLPTQKTSNKYIVNVYQNDNITQKVTDYFLNHQRWHHNKGMGQRTVSAVVPFSHFSGRPA